MVAVSLLAGAAWVLAQAYPLLGAPAGGGQELSLLKADLLAQLRPEPVERLIFQTLCVLAPFLAWGLTRLALRLEGRVGAGRWRTAGNGPISAPVLSGLVALALFYPLVDSDFLEAVLGLYQEYQVAAYVAPLVTAGAVLGALAWSLGSGRRRVQAPPTGGWPSRRLAGGLAWAVFMGTLILNLLAWRLFGIGRVTLDQAWFTSMDAAVYALSQVAGGRTLLVDLPSQYGLFPEFLAPLFRVIGLSLFKLSVVFALLQGISLALVFAVLARYVKGRGLLTLSGLALLSLTFGTCCHVPGNEEIYFQYWPVRFFWPALSVWMFARFLQGRTLAGSGVVSLVAAAGILWNLDTGLAIWLAFGGYLFFRGLGALARAGRGRGGILGETWRPGDYLKAGMAHVGMALLLGLLFYGYLQFKAEGPVNLGWLVRYQFIFYKLGFMMLPLPLQPHPWMSVLALYLLGLLHAFRSWSLGRSGRRADMVAYLAFLGIGLFVYYQGRSHVLNLVSVSWPALIISAILADEALRLVRQRLVHAAYLALPTAALAVLLLAAGSFLYKVPSLGAEAEAAYRLRDHFRSDVVRDEVSFIAANAWPGRQCLILSRRQGIYYTETGLVSPVGGPGAVESMLRADDELLASAIEQGRPDCLFLAVGEQSRVTLPLPLERILGHYRIARTSPGGSLLYLVPSTALVTPP